MGKMRNSGRKQNCVRTGNCREIGIREKRGNSGRKFREQGTMGDNRGLCEITENCGTQQGIVGNTNNCGRKQNCEIQ